MKTSKIELSTIIGKKCIFKGNLTIHGGIRIDGTLDGELQTNGFVIIGKTGVAKANITAKDCIISGVVEGNVNIEGTLELEKSASIKGDVSAMLLKVETGANFMGNCNLTVQGNKQ